MLARSSTLFGPKVAPVFKLARLRAKTMAAASAFHDYNFRVYFMEKTNDTFNEVARKSDEEIRAFVTNDGLDGLAQMRRMAMLDATYSRTPVFLDPAISSHVKKRAEGLATGGSMDDGGAIDDSSLPHAGGSHASPSARAGQEEEEDKDE